MVWFKGADEDSKGKLNLPEITFRPFLSAKYRQITDGRL